MTADLFITRRPYLLNKVGFGWLDGVLCATPERATAMLALLLRRAREYPVAPYQRTGWESYMSLATEALLPGHGDWGALWTQESFAADGALAYHGDAVSSRLFKALLARDDLAVALSSGHRRPFDETEALERFVVFLLAAFDAAARASNLILCRPVAKGREAKWQRVGFLHRLRGSAPELAALFDGDHSPGQDVLRVLLEIRNCIHGGGVTGQQHTVQHRHSRRHLSVPFDEVPRLMEAVQRRVSARPKEKWGIHQTGSYVCIEPEALVETLLAEALLLLCRIFALTTSCVGSPPSAACEDPDRGAEQFQFQNGWLVEQLVTTSGSPMYRWHFGLEPS
ncbi:MAG TPA: hypothetical protein VFJ21_01025 [Mycobacteriales bacterium]|nr:hypothetical protein [Mycobacteriales bacterium]